MLIALLLGGGRLACEAGLALPDAAWSLAEALAASSDPHSEEKHQPPRAEAILGLSAALCVGAILLAATAAFTRSADSACAATSRDLRQDDL